MREQLLEIEPHNAQTEHGLLMTYADYCVLLGIPWSANMGRPAEARIYCQKALALARQLSAADPKDQTARFDLGYNLGQLGMVEPDPDTVADSLKNLEEALSILDPMVRANPSSADLVLRVELVRQYAGRRLQTLGRLTEAADSFRQALAELEAMTNAKPGQPQGTAVALGNEDGLAEIYAVQGDADAGLTHAGKGVDRAEKYSASHPGRAPATGQLGEAYFELAWVERTLGDWDRAAADADRAMSLWRSIDDKGVLSVHRQARERSEALASEIAAHRAQ
jgi:tetratricopeptide (TPR) repeat protein